MNNINSYELEFTKVKERVEFLLKNNTAARNDDTTLCFLYWLKFENLSLISDSIILTFAKHSDFLNIKGKLTPPESITRVRRVIQCKEGKYLPEREVIKERLQRQEQHKEFFGNLKRA